MSLQICHTKGIIEAGCDEAGRGCLAGPVEDHVAVAVAIKGNTQVLKILFNDGMVFVNDGLSGGTFLGCLNRNRCSMLITSTYKNDISLLRF